MNFFSHGFRYVDQPYFLAGTAVPDWLSYLDRRIRARRVWAQEFIDDVDPLLADVARGVVQHHEDDHRFHGSRAFVELSMQLAILLRDQLPPDDSLRPTFIGHIIIEMILDAEIHRRRPGLMDAYYHALLAVNPESVQSAVNRITKKPTSQLATLIPRFSVERFLYDYSDDGSLLIRLNQVLRRVGLEALPEAVLGFVATARRRVREDFDALLATNP